MSCIPILELQAIQIWRYKRPKSRGTSDPRPPEGGAIFCGVSNNKKDFTVTIHKSWILRLLGNHSSQLTSQQDFCPSRPSLASSLSKNRDELSMKKSQKGHKEMLRPPTHIVPGSPSASQWIDPGADFSSKSSTPCTASPQESTCTASSRYHLEELP